MNAQDRLRLYDELDDLTSRGSSWRRVGSTAALSVALGIVAWRLLEIAFDVGLGLEVGTVLLVAVLTLGSLEGFRVHRVRSLRRRIEAEDRAEPSEAEGPRLPSQG